MVRSNASWVMVTWEAPVDRHTDTNRGSHLQYAVSQLVVNVGSFIQDIWIEFKSLFLYIVIKS